jgi:hypothetical protein
VELKSAVGLLNEYLSVTQSRLRVAITRIVIPLPHARAADNAVYSYFAKRSGIEEGRREFLQRTCDGLGIPAKLNAYFEGKPNSIPG